MFRITADNPKGLDYDHSTEDMTNAASAIARMANRGAENICINGELADPELVNKFVQLFTVKA